MPLADADIDKEHILDWWDNHSFDLQLPNNDPAFGNCDLCFLKGMARVERVIREQPELAQWWIDQEAMVGARFRKDRPTYHQIRLHIAEQGVLFNESIDDHTIPCDCTD